MIGKEKLQAIESDNEKRNWRETEGVPGGVRARDRQVPSNVILNLAYPSPL